MMVSLAKIRADFSFYRTGKIIQYLVVIIIAIMLAFAAFRGGIHVPVIIMNISAGVTFILLCLVNIEIGFYSVIVLGFVVADVERAFMDQYPLTSVLLAIPWLLICLLLFKEMQRKNFKQLPWHPIIYLYFLSSAYLLIEIFNPQMDSLLGWLSAFWQRISYLFLLFISCYIFKDLKGVRFFFKFFIVMVFLSALYGCTQQWWGLLPFDHKWLYDHPQKVGLYSLPGDGLRRFSCFTDPANFGTFMAAGALAVFVLTTMSPFRKGTKVLLTGFMIIILLGMSYSGTRTANLMLAGGLAIYFLMTIYQKKTRMIAGIAGLAFLLIMYIPIYGNVTLNRFRSAFNSLPSENASYDVRLIHRSMMQPYMHAHPFGGGVNTSGLPGTKYNPHHFLAGFPPDGAYFAVALDTGWIGLMINCLFLFTILYYCVHYFFRIRNPEIKAYYAALTIFIFSLSLGAITQFTISSVPQSLIFIPMLAIIVKLHTFDVPISRVVKS